MFVNSPVDLSTTEHFIWTTSEIPSTWVQCKYRKFPKISTYNIQNVYIITLWEIQELLASDIDNDIT